MHSPGFAPLILSIALLLSVGTAHAQRGYGVEGELLATDRTQARQALEKQFGREVSGSYQLAAGGCIVPACTDVQRRTAVFLREVEPLQSLRREQEVHCSAPPAKFGTWACNDPPETYVYLPLR